MSANLVDTVDIVIVIKFYIFSIYKMDRTIVIVLVVLLVVIALIFLSIGLFGKHYVCNNGECNYNYFELNGMTNSECNSKCVKPTSTQNEMVTNNVNEQKKYSCNEETGQCFQNENGLYNNQNNCEESCKKIVKETRFVPVPYRDTVRIYERPRYFHNRLHPPPYPPYPPYPPPAPVPPAPVPPAPVPPMDPEPIAPEPIAPEPLPLAPEPIAPEPIAPEPIAPEPIPPPPVESYCYFYN